MTWNKLRGYWYLPAPYLTPTIDTAMLVQALKQRPTSGASLRTLCRFLFESAVSIVRALLT